MLLVNILTIPESEGTTLNPEGSKGELSARDASIRAKISSEQAPTAFSSTPLQSCPIKMPSSSIQQTVELQFYTSSFSAR